METTPDTMLPAVLPCAEPSIKFLYETALGKARNPNTTRAYRQSLADFSTFLKADEPIVAIESLLQHPHGTANAVVSAYRNHLVERGMAPASVNSRLGALRSIVKDAKRFGLVNWTLDVVPVRSETYRDTRGPGGDGFKSMLAEVEKCENEAKRCRDRVILRLLHDMGLRRNEVASLNLADVDFSDSKVSVMGKGKTQKVLLTVPDKLLACIKEWVSHRGTFDGPLIVNMDRARQNEAAGRRLSGEGIRQIVADYGKAAGIGKVRPHGLRHRSITRLLERGIDIRNVQKFSRHAKLDIISIYDDRRKDTAGELANLLSDEN